MNGRLGATFFLYVLALGAGVNVATQLDGSLRMALGSPAWAGLENSRLQPGLAQHRRDRGRREKP
jgi:hypothetical protein